MKPLSKIALSLVLVCSLFTQACTSSQVSTVLSDVVKASDIAEIGVSGACAVISVADPALALACNLANSYLVAANTATAACATEVATMDTQSTKYDTCITDYAHAVVPNLPDGTNPVIASALGALGASIKAVLDIIKPPAAASVAELSSSASFHLTEVKIGMLDRYHLHSAARHFKKNAEKASARIK